MKITPNIMFETDAREASESYSRILGADRLDLIAFADMPFAATSWSPGFGMTRDRFGKDWMVNTNQETVP